MKSQVKKVPQNICVEYIQWSKHYQELYGEDTVLLYMVGSFYEIYSLSLTNDISDITPLSKVTQLCHLNVAFKQSNIGESLLASSIPPFPIQATETSIANWLTQLPVCHVVMAGFRDYTLDKYVEKLTEHGFTVVIYDQVKTKIDTTEVIQRTLKTICSPGTYLSDSTRTVALTNHITCVWVQRHHERYIFGIANVNTFTSDTQLFEHETTSLCCDELERKV